jgi:pimeloyl-ACP methyl ester carboxylesterase
MVGMMLFLLSVIVWIGPIASGFHIKSTTSAIPSCQSDSFTTTQLHALLSLQATELQKHSHITFVSPLLEDGYPPAVKDYQQSNIISIDTSNTQPKPLLLYLPGFDGTILAPFIQFPSLGESFDVRGMKIGMDNRSTFDELKTTVLNYLSKEQRQVYLMGESFGGILAIEVARDIASLSEYEHVSLGGLILINPATSYLRSSLYRLGPSVANHTSFLPPITFIQYVISLISRLVPLFLDEGKAFQQLVLMLSSKGLPAVLNTPSREAYLGRVAFDLANRLKFMPQETLKWRLEQWLESGCTLFENRLKVAQQPDNGKDGLDSLKCLKTLIVAGELDLTLPSVEEAKRLSLTVFDNAKIHVVESAGHASTCGGSLQLIQLMRDFFPGLDDDATDTKYEPSNDPELFGLVSRYDDAMIGMSPLEYWREEYYQTVDE